MLKSAKNTSSSATFARFALFAAKQNHRLIALFFSLLGLYLRYKRFAQRDLWGDELLQLKDALGPLRPLWARTTPIELTCFPGDYLLTYPFAHFFGTNKWLIAIPHITATLLGFYFLYLICRRYLKTTWGFIFAFAVVCFNEELIFHAFEIRAYAVLPTLALAAFYLTELIFCQPQRLSAMKKFLIGLFFTFTVIYHAYGIMIVVFCALFFFLSQIAHKSYREAWGNVSKFYSVLFLVTIPLFLWYVTGRSDLKVDYIRTTFQFIPNPLENIFGFLKAVIGNLVGYKKLYFTLLGIIFAFLIPHKERLKQFGFLLVLVILPIQVICLIDISKEYWFIQRQFVWVMPLFALLIGWSWDSIVHYFLERFRPRTHS